MSFKDLTNKESALDKAKGAKVAKGTKQPDKATPAKDPASTPEKPHPKG
jgi:hypothetical protein